MKLVFIFVALCISYGAHAYRYIRDNRKKLTCEKVRASTCLNRVHEGYNSTSFPNLRNHKTQNEAIFELRHYDPLINIGCSEYLATFLCSLYIPLCTPDLEKQIKPCRSLCLHSMRGCKPVMENFGVEWQFDCNEYPDGRSEVCIGRDIEKQTKEDKNGENNESSRKHKGKSRKGWVSSLENETINLECSYGKVIYIRKIRHSGGSRCCPTATKIVLSAMCNGNTKCNISVSANSLGGHCKDKIGKLSIRYKCVYQLKEKPCAIKQKNGQ